MRPPSDAEPLGHALVLLMSALSEDTWRAGWYLGVEFIFWRRLEGRPWGTWGGEPGKDLEALYALGLAAGVWPMWSETESDVVLVPLDEWAVIYAASDYGQNGKWT